MPIHNQKFLTDKELSSIKSKTPIFFGVEVEGTLHGNTGSETSTAKAIRLVENLQNYVYGQCSDGGGREVALRPMTKAFAQEDKIIETLLSRFKDLGFVMDESNHAGLHIHVGREYFTADLLMSLVDFMGTYPEHFARLFRRNAGHGYAHQGRPVPMPESERATYKSRFVGALKGSHEAASPNVTFAVSRKSLPTVEFRCFQATESPKIIYAYMELITSLINFLSDDSVTKNWTNFKRYIKSEEKDNMNLITLIKNVGIPITASKVEIIDPKVRTQIERLKALKTRAASKQRILARLDI